MLETHYNIVLIERIVEKKKENLLNYINFIKNYFHY